MIAHVVSKSTQQGRRAELAAVFEAAVGEVTEGNKAESFLAKRVGEGAGTLVSATCSSVTVAPIDKRVVLGLNFAMVKGTTLQEVNDLPTSSWRIQHARPRVQVTNKHLEAKWSFLRVLKSTVTKPFGTKMNMKFVSEDNKVKVQISAQSPTGLAYYVEEGSSHDVGAQPVSDQRVSWTESGGGQLAKKKKGNQRQGQQGPGKGSTACGGDFPQRYGGPQQNCDHGTARYRPVSTCAAYY